MRWVFVVCEQTRSNLPCKRQAFNESVCTEESIRTVECTVNCSVSPSTAELELPKRCQLRGAPRGAKASWWAPRDTGLVRKRPVHEKAPRSCSPSGVYTCSPLQRDALAQNAPTLPSDELSYCSSGSPGSNS